MNYYNGKKKHFTAYGAPGRKTDISAGDAMRNEDWDNTELNARLSRHT
jgi:hypothetical protein